jgi:hypothetical protein
MMNETTLSAKAVLKRWLRELRIEEDAQVDHYLGKRLEPRFFPWCEPLEIRVNGKTLLARGENLSRDGMGFVCKANLERGLIIEMRRDGEDEWITMRVQHATQTISGFKIGARVVSAPLT